MIDNHAAQSVRNFVGHILFELAPVRQAMAYSLAEVSVGYGHSSLNGPAARLEGPAPGERVPQVPGQQPVGAGDAPRLALFAAADAAVARLLRGHAQFLEPTSHPALRRGGLWPVWPDG